MFSRMLAIGILPASAPSGEVDVPAAAQAPASPTTQTAAEAEPKPVPWNLLIDRRLEITSDAGTTREGIFLGTQSGAAVLEADDGTLISIALDDVAGVRTVKQPPPPSPTIPITSDRSPLAFREQQARVERLEGERLARVVNAASVAGGVIASLSAASSIVAEGFNIRRWSLSRGACGEVSYYYGAGDDRICGWTDGSPPNDFATYSSYDNIAGITGASTIAATLHFGGLLPLVPTSILRNRTGNRVARRRHLAAWGLWGAGVASLTANQAIAWTQLMGVREICGDADASTDCQSITRTRGAPPGLYLLSAGLTLSSAILAIIDGRSVARSAEAAAAADRAKTRSSPSIAMFPVSLQRGGGVGIAGKF